MKRKSQIKHGNYDVAQLTAELRYRWVKPNKPQALANPPYWTQAQPELETELIEDLLRYEWKVAFIRKQTTKLGTRPKGRTRADLLKQLITVFLEPKRIARQLGTLDAEEQRFYTYLLLYTNLEALQTTPTALDKLFRFSKTRDTLTQKMLDAGMGLADEEARFFVPNEIFSQFPPSYIEMETAPEPKIFVKASDPQILVSRVQQWLGLLQSDTYQQRTRPRWNPPNAGYYQKQNVLTWPLVPKDVRKIIAGQQQPSLVTLCAPEPYLDEPTLASWSAALDLSPDMVEWLYHMMISTGAVLAGSPLTLDQQVAQQWLLLPPGRQMTILYKLYRSLGAWSDWWPAWRAGHVNVQWQFRNAWQLTGIDRAMTITNYMLRWVLLDILTFMPHEAWLVMDKVSNWISRLYPAANTHIYQQDVQLTRQGDWTSFLPLALKKMLCGPLYEMGFVDLAPTRENPTHFRLHYLQDIHWGRFSEVPTSAAQPFSAQTVMYVAEKQMLQITPPVPADFLMAIQQWAKPSGLAGNRLYYQLDVERLHTAFERGETPETLAAAWEAHSDFAPLPAIVAWWQQWWSRYGHIRIYPHQATLVTRDDFTMQEVQLALPTLREAILGLVTPRAALLKPAAVDGILKDLRRQVYMPQEDD